MKEHKPEAGATSEIRTASSEKLYTIVSSDTMKRFIVSHLSIRLASPYCKTSNTTQIRYLCYWSAFLCPNLITTYMDTRMAIGPNEERLGVTAPVAHMKNN